MYELNNIPGFSEILLYIQTVLNSSTNINRISMNESYVYLQTSPRLCFAPGIAIFLVVFSFNVAGDRLRDALVPRLRGLL
jgi:hypothetical protein